MTAVEKIIEYCKKQKNIDLNSHRGVYFNIIRFCEEQAKEMEKEQMETTWNNAIDAELKDKWDSYDDFYKTTFKSE